SDVFERISAVTQPVLAHDAIALTVLLPDGRHARVYASHGLDVSRLPQTMEVPPELGLNPDWEYDLIDDTVERSEPHNARLATLGYRSALRVPMRRESRFVGALVFLSRMPSLYKPEHLQVARRAANRIAVSLERERGVEAARRADEATDRAARLEARVRAL